MDPEGNVIAVRRGAGNGPVLVLAAHQDTVFPAGTDVKVREENGILHATGISDAARGRAVILQVLRTLEEEKIETVGDIYFVCTVGEEGNGDLRGSKYLFHKSGLPIDGFISIDGVDSHRVLSAATGSKRYRVHFDGPGGHSWKNYGYPSAIHAMGRAIAKIADVEPCADPKTTFTCGTIAGGTTVNSIAAHCEMELDMRSAGARELDESEAQILPLIEAACKEEHARWNAEGETIVKLRLEPIGHRPGGQQDDSTSVLQASRAAMAAGVLTALLLTAFAGVLLQRYSPAFALLLSLGAAVWLLLRLAQPLRGVLQAMVQLGQRTNAQAFSCLLRSAGILLLADYVRTLCEEAGADTLAWCAGLAGRCLVLAAVWPLLEQIFQTIWGLVG